MSYGWLLVIIVIAGAALYAMGILNPGTYMKTGCVGFEKVHYKDHVYRGTPDDRGIWTVWSSETERESVFQLRVQNGAGQTLRIRGVDVEYPESVHVTWSERGYDCDYYNTAGDTTSGCQEQNVSEAEVTTLKIEDVGRGMLDLQAGAVYRMKVKVTFDVFNALADHTEVAICSGKKELGSVSSSGSSGPSATYAGQWGTEGTGDGEFRDPFGIAMDGSGNVFVIEFYHRVQKFTGDGTFVTKWGSQGTGDYGFDRPYGGDVDNSGNVYVADTYNDRVQVFDNNGNYARTIGSSGSGNGQLDSPFGLTVDGSGYVYVADSLNHRIQVFDPSGAYVRKWGSFGTGTGQFNSPHDIALDSSDNVYVSDSNNYRIQVFTSTGTFLRTWGSSGSGDDQFGYPKGIDIDGSDRVYVVDRDNARVQVFDTSGTFVHKWGTAGSGDGEFFSPYSIAIQGSSAYVTDSNNERVQKFTIT